MNTKTTMTDEEHEQLEARRKHGAKGTAYLPPADKSAHTPETSVKWAQRCGELQNAIESLQGQLDNLQNNHDALVTEYNALVERTEANARLIAAAPDYHDKAHKLAMRILQSDFYRYAKQEVDDVLDVWRKVEGISCA